MQRRVPFLIITAATIITTCCSLLSPVAVFAATATAKSANPANNGQALEIAPPVITLTLNPGQTIKTDLYLRNISSGNLIVTGQVNDFVAAGEDGTPKILLNGDDNNPYSMKSWVGSLPSMLVVPRQIKTLPITITAPTNASPGGHYGVIRFTATPPELNSTGVSLSASLGALVLVTVSGKINESLAVQEFSVNHADKSGTLFESGPLNFVERFKNSGNVHVEPTGQVTITDMLGHKVAAVNVNLPPRNILPNSSRKFEEPLDKTVIGNKLLLGRYNAKLSVTYGTGGKALSANLTFWVIPYRLIAGLTVGLIAGFFALRFMVRRYNRHIITQSQKRR